MYVCLQNNNNNNNVALFAKLIELPVISLYMF